MIFKKWLFCAIIFFASCCHSITNPLSGLESANENVQKNEDLSQKPMFSADYMGKMMATFFKELETKSKMPNVNQDFHQQKYRPQSTTTTTEAPIDYDDLGKNFSEKLTNVYR